MLQGQGGGGVWRGFSGCRLGCPSHVYLQFQPLYEQFLPVKGLGSLNPKLPKA